MVGLLPVGRLAKFGPIRNATLAGKAHSVTGIPFDKQGFPDFSSVMIKEVEIPSFANRKIDARLANREGGLTSTPEGYIWHHHQDGKTMQLIPEDIHAKTAHTGGFSVRGGN